MDLYLSEERMSFIIFTGEISPDFTISKMAGDAPETSAAPVSVSFTGTQPERLLTFQKMKCC